MSERFPSPAATGSSTTVSAAATGTTTALTAGGSVGSSAVLQGGTTTGLQKLRNVVAHDRTQRVLRGLRESGLHHRRKIEREERESRLEEELQTKLKHFCLAELESERWKFRKYFRDLNRIGHVEELYADLCCGGDLGKGRVVGRGVSVSGSMQRGRQSFRVESSRIRGSSAPVAGGAGNSLRRAVLSADRGAASRGRAGSGTSAARSRSPVQRQKEGGSDRDTASHSGALTGKVKASTQKLGLKLKLAGKLGAAGFSKQAGKGQKGAETKNPATVQKGTQKKQAPGAMQGLRRAHSWSNMDTYGQKAKDKELKLPSISESLGGETLSPYADLSEYEYLLPKSWRGNDRLLRQLVQTDTLYAARKLDNILHTSEPKLIII
jgi:hypothetical protein